MTCILHIIVVNYQTPELTLNCLASVEAQRADFPDKFLHVTLVDNASPDGSGQWLAQQIQQRCWSDWVTMLTLDENRGFAGGNNAAINDGPHCEFLLFLNSDTIVHPDCLATCVHRMRDEVDIGALTCRLLNEDGSIQNSVRKFPTPPRMVVGALGLPWKLPRLFGWANLEDPGWDRATERQDVDWIGGAFLMVRRDLIDRIGGFDESFFFYGEDIELCHRIHRAGYRCVHEPTVATTHLGGGSSDATLLDTDMRSRYRRDGRRLVYTRLYGGISASLVLAFETMLATARRGGARFRRQSNPSALTRHTIRDTNE